MYDDDSGLEKLPTGLACLRVLTARWGMDDAENSKQQDSACATSTVAQLVSNVHGWMKASRLKAVRTHRAHYSA